MKSSYQRVFASRRKTARSVEEGFWPDRTNAFVTHPDWWRWKWEQIFCAWDSSFDPFLYKIIRWSLSKCKQKEKRKKRKRIRRTTRLQRWRRSTVKARSARFRSSREKYRRKSSHFYVILSLFRTGWNVIDEDELNKAKFVPWLSLSFVCSSLSLSFGKSRDKTLFHD